MASSTRRSSSALALDTYDPFGASSSSFLPPMGLFSPVAAAPSPSTRTTPNFCATIFEEEDAEESCATSTITPSTPDNEFQRRQSAFAIHPRILRSDSCSDDDSDIPPVLRFPVPPSTIPSASRSPPKLKPVSIPPPPPQLKSCFEDDDEDEQQQQVVVAPSPVASRRSSPTTTLMASRPAPPPPNRPFSLLKKATSALKSSSPPRSSPAAASKPLPKVPHAQRPRITPAPYNLEQQPISVSPTPSLSSSSSSSDCSSATLPYIPVGSIIPAPAIVQDLDDYLETLEMYFPSELWEDHPHELRRKPNSAAAKSRSSSSSSSSSAHRKRPSNSSSSSSCSRSSSDENLQHRRKSSFDDAAAVDVQRLLKNSASSGNMKLASYTSTSSTTVRISSPLSPPAEIRSHSRSGSDSPTSTAYSSSSSSCSSSSSPSNSSTITPGSRTPSPTFAKHATPLSPPKSILKPSKSSPLLRDRSTSVSSTMSVVSPPPVPRSSSRSSAYNNVPMSPTRGRAPVPMHQLLSR